VRPKAIVTDGGKAATNRDQRQACINSKTPGGRAGFGSARASNNCVLKIPTLSYGVRPEACATDGRKAAANQRRARSSLEEAERTGSGLRLRRRLLNQISCELRHPPPVPTQPIRAILPAGRPSPTHYHPLPQHYHALPRHYHALPRIATHYRALPLPRITTHYQKSKHYPIKSLSRTPCALYSSPPPHCVRPLRGLRCCASHTAPPAPGTPTPPATATTADVIATHHEAPSSPSAKNRGAAGRTVVQILPI
jgi:hypothetical protein